MPRPFRPQAVRQHELLVEMSEASHAFEGRRLVNDHFGPSRGHGAKHRLAIEQVAGDGFYISRKESRHTSRGPDHSHHAMSGRNEER
jgi:hypothetical protein